MIKGKLLMPKGEYSGPTDGRYILIFKSTDKGVYLSSDAGATFVHTGITASQMAHIRGAISGDGKHIRVAGLHGYATSIYGSDDFGETWRTYSAYGAIYNDVKISNNGRYQIATADHSEFYYSNDFGNWFYYTDTGVWRSAYKNLCITDTGDFAITASMSGNHYPLISRNYGVSWMDYTLVSDAASYGCAMSANGQYCLIVYGSGINRPFWRSSDYGYSWVQVSSPMNNLASGAVISHTGQYQCFLEDSGWGAVYFSHDFGNNWYDVRNGLPSYGRFLMPSVDENVRYVTSFSNTNLYRTYNGGYSWDVINIGDQYDVLAINKFLG